MVTLTHHGPGLVAWGGRAAVAITFMDPENTRVERVSDHSMRDPAAWKQGNCVPGRDWGRTYRGAPKDDTQSP